MRIYLVQDTKTTVYPVRGIYGTVTEKPHAKTVDYFKNLKAAIKRMEELNAKTSSYSFQVVCSTV